jgi:hypothetical protein
MTIHLMSLFVKLLFLNYKVSLSIINWFSKLTTKQLSIFNVTAARRNATSGIWVPKGTQMGISSAVASHVSTAACFFSMECVPL